MTDAVIPQLPVTSDMFVMFSTSEGKQNNTITHIPTILTICNLYQNFSRGSKEFSWTRTTEYWDLFFQLTCNRLLGQHYLVFLIKNRIVSPGFCCCRIRCLQGSWRRVLFFAGSCQGVFRICMWKSSSEFSYQGILLHFI